MSDLVATKFVLRAIASRGSPIFELDDERPDEVIRWAQAVDFTARCPEGTVLAIEHTLVEPYEGFVADWNLTDERLGPVRKGVAGQLAEDSVFDIHLSPRAANAIRPKHQTAIAAWILETAPTLSLHAPGHWAQSPPGLLPTRLALYRWPLSDGHAKVPQVRYRVGVDMSDIARKSALRTRRALRAKLPKLEAARVDGADATLLVLETGDFQMTNPSDLGLAVRDGISESDLPLPDYILLVTDGPDGEPIQAHVYRERGDWLGWPAMVVL